MEKGAYIGCKFSMKDLQVSADLQPVDPDLLRVPVLDKLQKQLMITKKLLSHQDGTKNKWKPGTDLKQLLSDIKPIKILRKYLTHNFNFPLKVAYAG